MFLRKTKQRDPLPVTMSGVRMGERLLQVGMDDASLVGVLAAKVGLSGAAAIVVADAAGGERARAQALNAGVLMDVHVSPLDRIPLGDAGIDVVIVHNGGGEIARLDAATRGQAAREWHRVLRPGGRAMIIDRAPRRGLRAMVGGGSPDSAGYAHGGGSLAVLESGGFRPVRTVGEVEGLTFTEGLKS